MASTTESSVPSVYLCITTFRRPDGLRKLLTHVARLNFLGALRIVVVDNDDRGKAGSTVVQELAANFPFPLIALVESRRGHTYAYNLGFAHACRVTPAPDYIAVLDDDEYPDPGWLSEMIRVALQYDADIVGGPVFPIFDRPESWLAKSGLYAPVRYATGPVVMIYGAGNMLIRRRTLETYLDEPFAHEFARTGGSDEEFFWRCRRDAHSFAWADEAHVFETTPASRTTVGYILRRRFRAGVGATRFERKLCGVLASAPRRWAKGLGLLGIGILLLPFALAGGRRSMMRSLTIVARGAGRLAAEFGVFYEEYR